MKSELQKLYPIWEANLGHSHNEQTPQPQSTALSDCHYKLLKKKVIDFLPEPQRNQMGLHHNN